ANNLMWKSWSGCIWNRGGGSPAAVIVNNTCFDYNQYGREDNNNPNPEGIHSGGSGTVVRNNIIFASNGTDPFDSSYTASHNACAAGKSCGSSSQTWTLSNWLSTDPNSPNFLMPATGSVALDKGTTVAAVTDDLMGTRRPEGGAYDIGALEFKNTG